MQTWQDLLLYDGSGSTFFQFCDALEVESGGKVAWPNGWGLEHALAAWGAYYKESFLPSCKHYPSCRHHSRYTALRLTMLLKTAVALAAN